MFRALRALFLNQVSRKIKKEKIYKYKRIGQKSALSALDYKFYIMEDEKNGLSET